MFFQSKRGEVRDPSITTLRTKLMKNVLSVDLESWVHFYRDIFGPNIRGQSSERKRLDNGYITSSVNYILQLLNRYDVKATFFILGEIFDWYPELIFQIQQGGHEIGYHTHDHKILKNGSVLEEQLKQSGAFIETFKPKGFRAPQIYLTHESARILKDWGFEYSSSTYGEYSKRTNIKGLDEIPVSSFQYFSRSVNPVSFPRQLTPKFILKEIPFGSGLFFGLFQSRMSYFITKLEERGEPSILFVHPWQICQTTEINNAMFKLKVAFRRPLALPYTIPIRHAIEEVLSKHQFTSFKELRNGYREILE